MDRPVEYPCVCGNELRFHSDYEARAYFKQNNMVLSVHDSEGDGIPRLSPCKCKVTHIAEEVKEG